MLELIRSPYISTFEEFTESIISECLICSPYITFGPIRSLVDKVKKNKISKDIKINILTDISLRTVIQGATDISSLLYLFENNLNVSISYLPRIHAKVYIADKSSAIITSANFTEGGETRNLEYGVRIRDSVFVQRIQKDIQEYRELGAIVTKEQLEEIEIQVRDFRKAIKIEQKSISQKIRLKSIELEKNIEDDLIRLRVKHKSVNSIFSETLIYLLSQKPMSTKDLHLLIKDIHVDLCDDTQDRVVDGKHFGKLWKHQVRNAQVTLKKSGLIFYDKETQLWYKSR